MPLSASSTADDIVTAVEGELGVTLDAASKALWTAIVGALYTRIKADMQVASTVTVTNVSGVTPGPSVSGPGAGTATSSTIS